MTTHHAKDRIPARDKKAHATPSNFSRIWARGRAGRRLHYFTIALYHSMLYRPTSAAAMSRFKIRVGTMHFMPDQAKAKATQSSPSVRRDARLVDLYLVDFAAFNIRSRNERKRMGLDEWTL